MAILPEGFALPPLPYLLVLLVAAGVVTWTLRERRPAVTEPVVLALVPWMLAGAWLHVLFVVGAAPALIRPLLGTPAVYVSVAVLVGAVWLLADAGDRKTAETLAAIGVVAAAIPLLAALGVGLARGVLTPFWPSVALVVGLVVGWAWWRGLRGWQPGIDVTGRVGLVAVLGHAIDGVSTAVGVDVLGFGERTPLSRLVIEAGQALPTADLVGAGWLFVLVKLVVAGAVVWLLADLVREDPAEGRLLLLLVAAVGLGPGAHNLLLFTVA